MYSWKLSALFIIGLMLVTGVFSNAAMAAANDGKGAVTVAWSDRAIDSDKIGTVSNVDTALNAGSTHNVLQFTYTAHDSDANAINMSGGSVRITFPSGWKVSNKLIQVQDGGNVVYETGGMGNLDPAKIFLDDGLDADEKEAKANATVTFEADRHITVNLGSEWSSSRSDPFRELIIILSDVTAPIPSRLTDHENTPDNYDDDYAKIEFTCSSSAKNGTLSRLSPVEVKVGNILGDRDLADKDADGNPDGDETRDPLIREVKVTPARVFPRDANVQVTITFEAPGPMYGSSLNITIPEAFQPSLFDDTTVTVSGRSGATINGKNFKINEPLNIPIDKMDRGQRVTVSYRIETVGTVDTIEEVTAETTVSNGGTSVGAKVTGGMVSPVAGSGRMNISPAFIAAGSQRRDITLTYTAYTKLENFDIEIEPRGIITGSDYTLQKATSSDYGYVSGSGSSDDLEIVNGDTSSPTIAWRNITLEKNKTLKTTVRRVDISETAGNYDWIVRVGPNAGVLNPIEDDPTTDVDERPILSVVKTSSDAVRFETVGDNIFPAGSRQTITFNFIADSTPIRDGRVSLTIPSALGSPPTTAKDTPGRVTVTSDGTLEGNQPTVSGRTVNVAIERLNVGEAVTIKYGTDEDDKASEQAVLHYAANDAIRISGTFRVSSSASTRTAGSVTLKLSNIADGSGAATLVPTTIAAGSDNQVVEVTFTAAGTMDGGKVSLEIPPGWGSMQDDPTKRNYVTVTGSAVSALDVGSNRAIATVRSLGKGGSFRFIYGGGTSSSNNGVEVQDDIGIAQFTVKSDGDGDDVFALVTSDLKYEDKEKIRNPKKLGKTYADAPGVLQIDVTGASDGSGTVTVDPTEVRAAANDVQLVFTYTPTQTVVDGELKFTAPTGWSKPQVDDLGSPGYTEVDGSGLGTVAADGFSITVPIFFLDKTQSLTITYGATDEGRAVAATATGTDSFKIEIKGHEGGSLRAIQSQPTVRVTGQGSGRGKAVLTVSPVRGDTALYAGDTTRRLTITYTAAGQMVEGKIRLTIPPDWAAPSNSTLIVRPSTSVRYDRQMAVVEGVNLNPNNTVNFIYTGDVQPTVEADVTFAVAVHSGTPGDSFADVSGADTDLTVDIKEARQGSGSGTVTPTRVNPGDTGVNLTFTYTAVGEISAPREFRVQVPSSWTPPSDAATLPDNKGTYTVVHRHAGIETTTSVEKLFPIGRDMVARVRLGGLEVEAGDQIIFTYENADAPATSELSTFRMLFDGQQIQDSTQVEVGTVVPVPDPTPPPDDTVVLILTATIDKTIAKAGDTVTVNVTGTAGQRATFSVGSILTNVAMTEFPVGTYTGSVSVANLRDGVHTVTVNLNGPSATAGSLTVDIAAPTVTVDASPATAANGDTVTITATVSEAATSVTADVSALDTTQTAPIPLTLSNNTYSGSFTISDNNQAAGGMKTITVTATDAAGNSGVGFATVMLTSLLQYTSMIPAGTSLFHVPLDVEGLDTVGDLKTMLGSAASLLIVYDYATRSWNSRSDNVPITADLGIVLSMSAKKTVVFRGNAWGDGTSEISLQVGSNLIGLPVNIPTVKNVSDIIGLFDRDIVSNIIVSTGAGQFGTVGRAGDPADGPVRGDAAYLVIAGASATTTATVTGTGWRNSDMGGAAPIALAGYNVDGQTAVLDVQGAVVDEITGLAREGFRVKVKNLSTKTSLNRVTSLETEAGGYNMTFVDLKSGNAARIGDVLEISADSPSPLIGVKPVRHVVTADDVKSGILELKDLIAYEIPAETELLRNYPNPFNPETWIPYRLAEDADVSLTIYDVNGELVRSIDVGHQSAAVYESRAKAIYWDGRNRFGEQVASGIYFYSLSAGDFSATRKMVILK